MPSNTSTCEHGTSGTDEVLTATHEQHGEIITHLDTNNYIIIQQHRAKPGLRRSYIVAAAGIDEVGCFSLARAMLSLLLSDVIRDGTQHMYISVIVSVADLLWLAMIMQLHHSCSGPGYHYCSHLF